MAYSSHSSFSSPTVNSPPSPSLSSKVFMQRQYREKEGECFSLLRDIIKELTGEELQTRQEILRKAIDLLFAELAAKKQGIAPSVPPGMAPFTNAEVAQAHSGYSAQSSHWPQANHEFSEEGTHYIVQSHGQQYVNMPTIDPAFFQAGYQGYDHGYGQRLG